MITETWWNSLQTTPDLVKRVEQGRGLRGHAGLVHAGQPRGRLAGHAAHDGRNVRGPPHGQETRRARHRAAVAGAGVLRLRAGADADGVLCGWLVGLLQPQHRERHVGGVDRAVPRAHGCVGGHADADASVGALATATVFLCGQVSACTLHVAGVEWQQPTLRARRRAARGACTAAREEWWAIAWADELAAEWTWAWAQHWSRHQDSVSFFFRTR